MKENYSLENISLSELQKLAEYAGLDRTKHILSRSLGGIIANTGKLYADLTGKTQANPNETFNLSQLRAAEAERNCRPQSIWMKLFGRFIKPKPFSFKAEDTVRTDSSILIAQKPGTLESMPSPCMACSRGPKILETEDRAVCPVGASFAERMLYRFDRADLELAESLGCVRREDGKLEGQSTSLPLIAGYETTINGITTRSNLGILFPNNSGYTTELKIQIAEELYGSHPYDSTRSAIEAAKIDRNTYAGRIAGFAIGDMLVRRAGGAHREGQHIIDLAAQRRGIFSLCELPYEFTIEPNVSFALQSIDLVHQTAHIKNIPNAKIVDIGAGKGTLSMQLATYLNRPHSIDLIELKPEYLNGSERVKRVNGITCPVNPIIADIRDLPINYLDGYTHSVINLARQYERYAGEKGPIFDTVINALERADEMRYVALGGFVENQDLLELTKSDIKRLKKAGYHFTAISRSIQRDRTNAQISYVLTRD